MKLSTNSKMLLIHMRLDDENQFIFKKKPQSEEELKNMISTLENKINYFTKDRQEQAIKTLDKLISYDYALNECTINYYKYIIGEQNFKFLKLYLEKWYIEKNYKYL